MGNWQLGGLQVDMTAQVMEMTLDEQIGQTLVVGFAGTTVSPEVADLIRDGHVGGVILFARNVRDAKQVYNLTGELQAVARAAGHRYPLLITIDEENGVVRRLGAGTTVFPGNMALGATGSEELTREVARATGREVRALGVTMNLAPVVDVNNNPANPVIGVRSFGEDPAEVGRLGAAAVRGYRDAGVLTALKHFPGHGDTAVDSHLALPTIDHDLERLERVELPPFRAGLAAGADAVTVAHIAFPRLAPDGLPGTVAPAIVRGLLRERLGFEGVVLSDCMEMDAVARTIGVERAAVLALRAGIDLVFISHRHDRQWAGIGAIRAAVAEGALEEETVRRAAERVLRLKARGPSWDDLPTPGTPVPSWVGGEAHQRLAQDAYERAVTLVRNDEGLVPLRLGVEERLLVVYPRHESPLWPDDVRHPHGFFMESVRRRYPHAEAVPLSTRPTADERGGILRRAAGVGAVVVATMNANLQEGQAEVVRGLVAAGRRVIGIAVYNPYDLLAFPELRAYMATYEYTPPALEAATRVLCGEITPRGRLPVTLPGLYERGHGL